MKADLFKMDLAVDDEVLLKKNTMEKKIKRAADFAPSAKPSQQFLAHSP